LDKQAFKSKGGAIEFTETPEALRRVSIELRTLLPKVAEALTDEKHIETTRSLVALLERMKESEVCFHLPSSSSPPPIA